MTAEDISREEDDIILGIGELIEAEAEGVRIANPGRVREFAACEAALRKLMRGSASRIEVVPHDGSSDVGVIRVLTKGFTVKDTETLAGICNLASNYEIYPRVDGKLMFALTFYGMTTKIGE